MCERMKILIVGGAGYIGSHMVRVLADRGHDVVTLDNMSSGHMDAILGGELVVGDCGDTKLLDGLFRRYRFDAVMDFAGCIEVGESVRDPVRFYDNNVSNVLALLKAMTANGKPYFVFSSSAAVYGEPDYSPIDEDHPKKPLSPYAHTKWIIEQVLSDYDKAYGFRSVSLRYFNAAGAHPDGILGERHDPETHLIPRLLQVASGRREKIEIFGFDYPTPDGTGIRDYIHVQDLCDAHLLALEWLMQENKSAAFNLGNGNGFSVKEVIRVSEQVTGKRVQVEFAERRRGDAVQLVADSSRARKILGWIPRYPSLKDILQHAWEWERKESGIASNQITCC